MEKPVKPFEPRAPYKYQFEKSKENVYIYKFTQKLREDDGCSDGDEEEEDKNVTEKNIEDVSLAWLLSKVPEGVDPSQVKIDFGYKTSAFAYEEHYINFYYERVIPSRPKEFKEAVKRHELEMNKHREDMKAYEENLRLYEIWEAEEKLSKLKS